MRLHPGPFLASAVPDHFRRNMVWLLVWRRLVVRHEDPDHGSKGGSNESQTADEQVAIEPAIRFVLTARPLTLHMLGLDGRFRH